MFTGENAKEIILDQIDVLGSERVDILSALGRVIAEDIFSYEDIPIGDTSTIDGYAVKSTDTRGASREYPIFLRVIRGIPVKSIIHKALGNGEAVLSKVFA